MLTARRIRRESFDKLAEDLGSFDEYLKKAIEEKRKKEGRDNNEDRKESSGDS